MEEKKIEPISGFKVKIKQVVDGFQIDVWRRQKGVKTYTNYINKQTEFVGELSEVSDAIAKQINILENAILKRKTAKKTVSKTK